MTKPVDPISISPNPTPPAAEPSAAADALAAKLFGVPTAEEPAEVEESPEPAEPTPVVAVPTAANPPGTVESAPEEDAEESVSEEILDLEALRAVAEKRKGKRDQKSATEQHARELEARLQAVETNAQRDRQAAEAFRALQQKGKADPIGLLETLGIDVVPFLQSGHRQAIDRQGHKQKTEVEQLKEIVSSLQERLEQAEATPHQLLQQQTRAAEAAKHRHEFVALTEGADSFPLLAAESASDRLALAQQVADALVEAGVDNITHELVAKTAEKELRRKFDKLNAALSRVAPSEETNGASHAGRQAPAGRSTGTSQTRPKTIRQSHAAEPAPPREKTPQERERAAEAILSRMFGRT